MTTGSEGSAPGTGGTDPAAGHLQPNDIRRFVRRELRSDEADRLEAHLDACERCTMEVADAMSYEDLMRAVREAAANCRPAAICGAAIHPIDRARPTPASGGQAYEIQLGLAAEGDDKPLVVMTPDGRLETTVQHDALGIHVTIRFAKTDQAGVIVLMSYRGLDRQVSLLGSTDEPATVHFTWRELAQQLALEAAAAEPYRNEASERAAYEGRTITNLGALVAGLSSSEQREREAAARAIGELSAQPLRITVAIRSE